MPKPIPRSKSLDPIRPGVTVLFTGGPFAGRTGVVNWMGISGLVYVDVTGDKCQTPIHPSKLKPVKE